MFRTKFRTTLVSCTVALALVGALGWAQEEKKGTQTKTAEKGKVKGGELPRYFGQIGLTDKEKEEIRRIAQPFDEKIVELRKQIKELEKQLDEQEAEKLAECEKHLSEGHKTALKERREEAEKAAAARKKEGKKATNGEEKKTQEKKTGN